MLVGVGLHEGSALGNLLALLNVACYSVYLVISRGLLRRYNALTVITWVFVFGVVGMLPWGLRPALREVGGMSTTTWVMMAYIVVFPSVAAYYLNIWALGRAESSLVSTFVYLQPPDDGRAGRAVPGRARVVADAAGGGADLRRRGGRHPRRPLAPARRAALAGGPGGGGAVNGSAKVRKCESAGVRECGSARVRDAKGRQG